MAKVFGVSEFQQNALPIFGGPNKPLKVAFETLESGRLPMSSLYPFFQHRPGRNVVVVSCDLAIIWSDVLIRSICSPQTSCELKWLWNSKLRPIPISFLKRSIFRRKPLWFQGPWFWHISKGGASLSSLRASLPTSITGAKTAQSTSLHESGPAKHTHTQFSIENLEHRSC